MAPEERCTLFAVRIVRSWRVAPALFGTVFGAIGSPGQYADSAHSGPAPSAPSAPAPSAPPAPSHPWVHLERDGLVARYHAARPGDSLQATRALDLLADMDPLPGLRRQLREATITIAPTRESIDSLAQGRVPEWAGAVAIPIRGEIIVPGGAAGKPVSRREEARILRHEWAHLALSHELEGMRIPRWFNEGYAEWASGSWVDGGELKLGLALALGRAPPLDSVALSWPRQRVPAEVAYLLSASVLHYLVQSSGVAGLEGFLAEWRRIRSFDGALRTVYGATPAQLESDWRRWVKRRYGWLAVLSHSAVFWTLLSAALASMFLHRRRLRREQLARLRAEEAPDDPAWWGQPDGPVDGVP